MYYLLFNRSILGLNYCLDCFGFNAILTKLVSGCFYYVTLIMNEPFKRDDSGSNTARSLVGAGPPLIKGITQIADLVWFIAFDGRKREKY